MRPLEHIGLDWITVTLITQAVYVPYTVQPTLGIS